jgi:hypothetical protein
MNVPENLRIVYDPLNEGRFDCLGCLPDGTQFLAFVTGAFPSGLKYYSGDDWRTKKQWLAVVHRFDADGHHLGTATRLGGFEVEGRDTAGDEAFGHLQDLVNELAAGGAPVMGDIRVRLFAVEVQEVTHGLFYETDEDEPIPGMEPAEWVMLEPLDVMFHPPWDSGKYSS